MVGQAPLQSQIQQKICSLRDGWSMHAYSRTEEERKGEWEWTRTLRVRAWRREKEWAWLEQASFSFKSHRLRQNVPEWGAGQQGERPAYEWPPNRTRQMMMHAHGKRRSRRTNKVSIHRPNEACIGKDTHRSLVCHTNNPQPRSNGMRRPTRPVPVCSASSPRLASHATTELHEMQSRDTRQATRKADTLQLF
jgi:hypothetical protein